METIRPIFSKTHPKDKPSIALLGLAISVGASSILLPQQTDSARSADFLTSELSDSSIQNSKLVQEPSTAQPALSTPQSNLTPVPHKIQNFSGSQQQTNSAFLSPPTLLEPPDPSFQDSQNPVHDPVISAFATQELKFYQVQAGDTLSAIASAYGVTVAQIVQLNHLSDPNQLQAGQNLKMPIASTARQTLNIDRLTQQDTPRFPSEFTSQVGSFSSHQTNHSTSMQTLKADLTKLRLKYQAHKNRSTGPSSTSTLPHSPENLSSIPQQPSDLRWQQASANPQPSSSPTLPHPQSWEPTPVLSETQSATVAVAPLSPESYQPQVFEMFPAEIPPLQEPEAYLPSISETLEEYIWPAQGVLTSGYGWRWGRMHAGIDIAGPIGTPVVAAGAGVVVYAGWNEGGYGNLVEIQHPDGSITRYAHNDRILVQPGQPVEAGQQISEMGSTGYSTGPHLHFEIHRPGQGAQNPIAYLPAP